MDGPVKQRLDTLAGELAKAADKELQVRLRRERLRLPDAAVFATVAEFAARGHLDRSLTAGVRHADFKRSGFSFHSLTFLFSLLWDSAAD